MARRSAPERLDGRRAEARGTARERLLDAAAEVFAERGYRASSVEDIATAAGLTKGAVYWNFDSKEDVFFALIEERVDHRARELMGVTEHAPREAATAPLISRGVSSFADEQQALVLLLHEYWSLAVRDDDLRVALRGAPGIAACTPRAGALSPARTTGVPLTVPAESLAAGIIALATGVAQERIADPAGVSEDLLGEMLSLLYDGLVHRAEQET